MFFMAHDNEELAGLVMILKYNLPHMTVTLNPHMIYQKAVMVLFQQIKPGTIEEVEAVLLYISSQLPFLA
jgi:hypothetical protein